jgi:mono/diheme cytochrome c family protein
LPFSPGEGNNKCTWCHRSVDLIEAAGSPKDTGNTIRKRIDPRLCSLCHGPSGPGKRFFAVDFPHVQIDGADLYGLTCSGCHGPLSNPDDDVRGEDAGDIREAIDENEGGMGVLAVLSDAQINSIAAALNGQPSPLPPPDGGTPPPPPPPAAVVANPDSANATQGVATAINVITNDSGTGINLTSFDSASNQGGTVSCTTAGLCNYTSAVTFTGTDTFGYTITDGLTSDSTTVTVTVSSGTPPPPPPIVANPDSASATQGVTTQINVLANDSGSGLTIASFDANSNQGGTVICSSTMCNYTSAANFTGTDTFSYTSTDGLTSDVATVTVSVTAPTIDGAALYGMHCAACHNALPGNQQGASATLIQNAINNNTGGMGGLNFLTTEEIQAISAAMQ